VYTTLVPTLSLFTPVHNFPTSSSKTNSSIFSSTYRYSKKSPFFSFPNQNPVGVPLPYHLCSEPGSIQIQCGICVGQSETATGFPPRTAAYPLSNIPPMLHKPTRISFFYHLHYSNLSTSTVITLETIKLAFEPYTFLQHFYTFYNVSVDN
jgi:hypothetical protein